MEKLDRLQLMSKESFIKAHIRLLNCGWRIAGFGSRSVLYKNKKDRLAIFNEGDNLLFRMNEEEAKELIVSNLIKAISI